MPVPGLKSSVGFMNSGYYAQAFTFDGTNDWLTRDAGLTGAADSKSWVFSVWLKFNGGDGAAQDLARQADSGNRFLVQRRTTNKLRFRVLDTGDVDRVDIETSTAVVAASGWIHFLCSGNVATPAAWIYLNDVSDYVQTTLSDGTLDWTQANFAIGAIIDGSINKLNADMADYTLWEGTSLDLSVTANRRLFNTGGNKPVNPQAAIAALGAPIVRLSGPASTANTNLGSGGGFTLHGTLTDSTTSPSN